MSDLYVNMCKLDYWTLRQSLDTVVTYHMMDKNYSSLVAYQAHELEYWSDVKDKIIECINADDKFVDVPEYVLLPLDDDGKPFIPAGPDRASFIQFDMSRIAPKKFITWCIENDVSVPPAFDDFIKGTVQSASGMSEQVIVPDVDVQPLPQGEEVAEAPPESHTLIKYALELGFVFADKELPSSLELAKHLKKCFKGSKPSEKVLEMLHQSLNEYQQQKSMSQKMADIAKQANHGTQKVKDRILQFVRDDIKAPCTCLHSQTKNRIVDGVIDPATGKTLWIDTCGVSETVLLEVVKKAYENAGEKVRIKIKNMTLPVCPVHNSVT